MTDFELNKAIAESLDLNPVCFYDKAVMNRKCERLDYCNNWNDLMPLVIEHGVSFLNYQVEYQATNGEYNECEAWTKENPQRMLAECLLKVLQSK